MCRLVCSDGQANKNEVYHSYVLYFLYFISYQHPVIETWCYEQMAMMSSAMAFSYSKWNSDTQDREKVLFQGCETLEDEPLPEVILTLNAPIATKVVCFSRLLKCLRSLYGKQCGPRSDCSYRSSLFWVHTVCFYT